MAPAGDRSTVGAHEPLIDDSPPAKLQNEDEQLGRPNIRSYSNGPDLKMWHSGICGCFSDIPTCLLTFICAPVAAGEVAEISSMGGTGCVAAGTIFHILAKFSLVIFPVSCFYSSIFRTRVRKMYGLPAEPCGDVCVHCWCMPCALCQELRELQARGWNPHISYQANMTLMEAEALRVPRKEVMRYY